MEKQLFLTLLLFGLAVSILANSDKDNDLGDDRKEGKHKETVDNEKDKDKDDVHGYGAGEWGGHEAGHGRGNWRRKRDLLSFAVKEGVVVAKDKKTREIAKKGGKFALKGGKKALDIVDGDAEKKLDAEKAKKKDGKKKEDEKTKTKKAGEN